MLPVQYKPLFAAKAILAESATANKGAGLLNASNVPAAFTKYPLPVAAELILAAWNTTDPFTAEALMAFE